MQELGEKLLEMKWELVYGGGNSGLMGALAETVEKGGGKVYSIIPTSLIGRNYVTKRCCWEQLWGIDNSKKHA